MIDGLIGWSIRHRAWVIISTILLACWGAYSVYVAPIDAIPDLSENQVIVHAEWPGHGPAEVEEQITSGLGLELNAVRGVKTVRTSSDMGVATLWVIFDDAVDVPTARRRVSDSLANGDARVKLPAGVNARLAPEAPATGQIFWYTVEGQGFDLAKLRAIQDWYVRPRLATVPGVAEVASVGGMSAELQVEVDPHKLRSANADINDVVRAVNASNGTAGAGVVHRANAEFVVRATNTLGDQNGTFNIDAARDDLVRAIVPTIDGKTTTLGSVATISLGPAPRRGALERDGQEVTGGVVLMAYGENPLALTDRLKAKVRELSGGLPKGVRIVPMYDRTPLIRGAVGTVSSTILEAMISASLCVLIILQHVRATFVIVITLPLSALASFGMLELLRRLGIADVPMNAMSLAGLAISIGVIVDSAIVMTENILHSLRRRFGDTPVSGEVTDTIALACRQVGKPIVFSLAIMLISFLPVFVLGGLEGKMFRPLATTKTFAMAASGLMAVTLVPALGSILARGRIRDESENRFVQSIINVYRPILDYSLDHPAPVLFILSGTLVLAASAIGISWLFFGVLATGIIALWFAARSSAGRLASVLSLIMIAMASDLTIGPLGREFLAPLDEGMVMDMPISVPRVSITQGIDDMKARNMILCRFPEVAMVVGKLGRAETPTDPAPLDMIETMVEFHPREFWPARRLSQSDTEGVLGEVLQAIRSRNWIDDPKAGLVAEAAMEVLPRFDAQMREYAYQRGRELFRSPGFDETKWRLEGLSSDALARWHSHVDAVDAELRTRGAELLVRLGLEELLLRADVKNEALKRHLIEVRRLRETGAATVHHATGVPGHAMSRTATVPSSLVLQPELVALQEELTERVARGLVLWKKRREDLVGFGGELDRAVPMPGWTNVWTMPIQNRVDMLSTGVNTTLGVRVTGRTVADVVTVSERIASVLKTVPGAADVIADPVRGKGAIEVRADRKRAERFGVSIGDLNSAVEAAIGGSIATTVRSGGEPYPVRVRYARAFREDEASIRSVLVRSQPPGRTGKPELIPLAEVAAIEVVNGPATIKGENGFARNYVRLNVRGRSVADFVNEARATLLAQVQMPEGAAIDWTGQYQHEEHARATLGWVLPVIAVLIFAILFATYRDLADACLMMLAVPGALAGGVACQWVMGTPFSVTVWVGYIACFGMATSTGVIMLVYLRASVEQAGGLERIDVQELRTAVLNGAAHRLRPKLLTEATMILGLAPMLWAGGVASEVIRPMAAPVLGGILVADEVIDLFLPILFHRVRLARWKRIHRASQD